MDSTNVRQQKGLSKRIDSLMNNMIEAELTPKQVEAIMKVITAVTGSLNKIVPDLCKKLSDSLKEIYKQFSINIPENATLGELSAIATNNIVIQEVTIIVTKVVFSQLYKLGESIN